MSTRPTTVNGIQVLFVEAAGTYRAEDMSGPGASAAKADWALHGAVAQGPDANWFFKFTAPQATIAANRQAFEALIASLARGT